MSQSPYTHVDPTQILNVGDGYPAFHASPSSDGWGGGVGSSSNASPEPYNASNASTPPSAEGVVEGNARYRQEVHFSEGRGPPEEEVIAWHCDITETGVAIIN